MVGGLGWEGINFTKSGPIIHVLYYCVRWNEGAGWGAGTLCWRVMVMAPRSLVLDGVQGWSWPAFSRTPVLFERTYRQIRTLGIRETFSQKLRNQAWSFKGNNWEQEFPMRNFKIFNKNWNIGKLESATMSLSVSQYLITSVMRSVVIETDVIFWYCNMKCVNIWKTSNSRIQYFPNDQSHKMWQNNTMVKHLFELQDRKMDFNVTDYKNLIDVSNSTLQLTF